MRRELYILKIGGRVIDEPEQLDYVLDGFSKVPNPKILVHGGGNMASEISAKLGIVPKMIDGRRITDEATLEVVTMVYGGLLNKRLVAQLQSKGVNALGLSGADGNIIPARKRPVKEIDFGFAGDLKDSSPASQSLEVLLHNEFVPICCPLTHDGKGQLLNTNADTIASHLGITLGKKFKVSLVYCLDKAGVLTDANDQRSVIKKLDPASYQQLVSKGVIYEGMIPKLDNAFAGLRLGIEEIYLGNWQDISGSSGTKISLV